MISFIQKPKQILGTIRFTFEFVSKIVGIQSLERLNSQKLSISVGVLAEAPIYIDDTPAMNILEIKKLIMQ